MKKLIILTLGGFISVSAVAGYELALIVDATNQVVRRYDPISNTDLGSIGMGYLVNPTALSLDPTNPGNVAVLSYTSVKWFNYSTGVMTKGFSIGSMYSNTTPELKIMSNGNVLVTGYLLSGLTSRIFSPTGTLLSTLSYPSGHLPVSTSLGSDNTIYTVTQYSSTNYYWTRFSSSGSYLSTSLIYSSGDPGDFQSLLVKGNSFYKIASGIGSFAPSFRYGTISGSSISFGSSGSASYFSYPTYCGLAEAHGNVYWIQSDGISGNQRIYQWDSYDNYSHPITELPYTSLLTDMIIISAPEPSTLIAGVVGVGAMLLRRRINRKR